MRGSIVETAASVRAGACRRRAYDDTPLPVFDKTISAE